MRIIQVVGAYTPERCGVAHYTARLGEELVSAGVDVAVASREGASHCALKFLPLAGFPGSLAGLVNLFVAARRWSADWLHVQYAPGSYDRRRLIGLLPLVARLVPGRPRVAATIHEYGNWPLRPWRAVAAPAGDTLGLLERSGWFDREALGLVGGSDLTIVTNPDHVATIKARSSALSERLRVIPIGPNVSPDGSTMQMRVAARQGLGVSDDQLIAIFFGFVHPVKGIETLLRALREVNAESPRIQLWIVGGVHSLALRGTEADGYEAKIRNLISELGLTGTAELTGYLADPETRQRLAAADLAVLPFNHGATLKSGTLITCLSYGLPLITTTGGDLGQLTHGENVWLAPPRDPAALAGAIGQLANDPALRARLGQAGAAATSAFNWPAIARRHVDLYQNGLTGANTSGSDSRWSLH